MRRLWRRLRGRCEACGESGDLATGTTTHYVGAFPVRRRCRYCRGSINCRTTVLWWMT